VQNIVYFPLRTLYVCLRHWSRLTVYVGQSFDSSISARYVTSFAAVCRIIVVCHNQW